MNFLEYTIEVPINEESDKRTTEIMNLIKEGRCCFNLVRYMDDEENDKKVRTFIITSYSNITQILYQLFNGLMAKYTCFIKTPVNM